MADITVSSDVDTFMQSANYAAMRSALDLEPGVDVQAYSSTLAAVAGGTYTGASSITTVGTITSGTWNGTALAVNKGGTGATDAVTARANLGLEIGVNVQAYNSNLDALGLGLYLGSTSITTVGTITTGTWNANIIAVNKGGTGASTDSGARTNLGLVIGTNVQAYSSVLDGVAAGNINNVAIGATTASTGKFTTLESETGKISAYTGFKNRVINGDMRIDQRNEGGNVTTVGANAYVTDKFRVNTTTMGQLTHTVARSTTNNARSPFSLSYTVGTAETAIAAGENAELATTIEGLHIADFLLGTANAKQMTLSFWVRSSLTGTFCVGLQNSAQDRSFIKEYTISVADTWEQKTITLTGDTTGTWLATNGIGMHIRWNLGAGSNFNGTDNSWQAGNLRKTTNQVNLITTAGATFYLTDVQLELGPTATEFERIGFADQLELCQRYYEKSFNIGTAPAQNTATGDQSRFGCPVATGGSSAMNGQIFFNTRKRAAPTITTFNAYAANAQIRNITDGADCSATAVIGESTHGFSLTFTTNAGAAVGEQLGVNWTANIDF